MTALRVATVVVTYNRCAVLAETLDAVRAQTRPPDHAYVVDNASDDGTGELLTNRFSDVVHVRMADNVGWSAGLAQGMALARSEGFDAFWLLDDDSPPEPHALEALVAATGEGSARTGIVGSRGGVIRFGLIRHLSDARVGVGPRAGNGPFPVDFVLLDGSLVLRTLVDEVGLPRPDYFIMLEDVEYTLRAGRAGFEVLVLGRDLARRKHLGSVPGSSPWRAYYQSRNHVRMALDFRSPSLFLGCLARQVRFMSAAFRAPDHRWERVKLRSRGVWDGLRGRMGRRVDPNAKAF
jgi:GT2 family glycosyltransferase